MAHHDSCLTVVPVSLVDIYTSLGDELDATEGHKSII